MVSSNFTGLEVPVRDEELSRWVNTECLLDDVLDEGKARDVRFFDKALSANDFIKLVKCSFVEKRLL